jgi:homoserine O-succinyltransferase
MKTVLDIGLVNNMPDAAREATERQFVTLLNDAADNHITVRLTFYALPVVPQTELRPRQLVSYGEIGDLWGRSLDGLIVTGTEPRATNLKDEPYWADMAQLLDWASQNTLSAVWSCLAAHAAVLHLDGIQRRRLSEKRFGIFNCVTVGRHFLNTGAPERLHVPHSRWNDLCEDELKAAGYEILTRIDDAGVDMFVKPGKSLFVFLQGHPEYDADTLLLEYRRDVKRFHKGESQVAPSLPKGYSDSLGAIGNMWRSDAVRLYRNWLSYLAEQKTLRASAAGHWRAIAKTGSELNALRDPASRLVASSRLAAPSRSLFHRSLAKLRPFFESKPRTLRYGV